MQKYGKVIRYEMQKEGDYNDFETCFKLLTGCEIFIKVLTMYVLHDILITVADAETQKTIKRN